jgi:RNA polymerase sigma-70 factor (ECF subfamily)
MSSDLEPDAALMLRVKRGDRLAFEALVDKYKQSVVNVIARTLGDPIEAEDLAQNVFVQVFRSAQRYQASAKFSTWLYTIARNLCLNEIRRRSRHPADSLDRAHPDHEEQPSRQIEDRTTSSPPEVLLRNELEQKVREALDTLPANQRAAIVLFQEEEMAYEEIAKVLGCSLPATKSLIHRGRATLRQKLKPYLRTGSWPAPGEAKQL